MTPGRGALAAMPMAKRLRLMRSQWQWYLLIAPAIVYLLIFSYFPMYGVIIAFKNYRVSRGILGSDWVGLQYFKQFITFPQFGLIMKNTICISLYSLATFPLSCILALMLNELDNQRFKKVVQMVSYAPHFISVTIMCAIIKIFFSYSNGLVNNMFASLGMARIEFLEDPDRFYGLYVWTGVWQGIGFSTIIYLAALSGVSPELIEAARIDGATRLKIIRHVNIPCIMPTIVITLILSCGRLLGVGFEKTYLLQNPLNLEASQVISTYVYDIGLLKAQYSYSSAIGLFNTVVNVACLLIVNAIAKSVSDVGIW